jgi:hypothetical protein
MPTYQCKKSQRLSKAEVMAVGTLLEDITSRPGADAKAELVARSKPKNSETHHLFEWDDTKAGHAYRLSQAADLIQAIEIVFEDGETPVRAFPSISVGDGERDYMPMQRVLSNAELTQQLIYEAKQDAEAWARRYEHLRHCAELHGVFRAVDQVVKTRGKKRSVAA